MKIKYFLQTVLICSIVVLFFGLFFVRGELWMPFADDLPDFLVKIPIWTLISQSGLLILAGLALAVVYLVIKITVG